MPACPTNTQRLLAQRLARVPRLLPGLRSTVRCLPLQHTDSRLIDRGQAGRKRQGQCRARAGQAPHAARLKRLDLPLPRLPLPLLPLPLPPPLLPPLAPRRGGCAPP